MSTSGDVAELEAELIKRNREIAKVRDEVLKTERRLEESQMRNDDLLEKVAELDSEVSQKVRAIAELEEEVKRLRVDVEEKAAKLEALDTEHAGHMEELKSGYAEKESAWHKERESHEAVKAEADKHKEHKDQALRDLAEEQRKYKTTKASLEQSEATLREHAIKANETRQRVKQLEEELEEERAKASTAQSEQLEMERTQMSAELHRMSSLIEEHRSAHDDLHAQSTGHEEARVKLSSELEDVRREAAEHKANVDALEAARDAAVKQYEEHKSSHDDILQSERKRNDEHLEKASQKAAQLDGRLSGQRMLLDETSQALMHSEREEERLSALLKQRGDELQAEREASEALAASLKEEAMKDASGNRARLISELESEEVVARRAMRAEIDEHARVAAEAEEQHRRLEAALAAAHADSEEAKGHHSRLHDTLRVQHQDLKQRLAEAEERSSNHQRDGDTLKKNLEDAKLEVERLNMAHRLEIERLQQTLEAEAQSRNSAEQVYSSRLEEKDTLLDHRKANIERLEQEIEDHKRKILEHQAGNAKDKEDANAKANSMGVRVASLEGELRKKQERITEAEGRLEAQRSYMEQLNETLAQAQLDRDSLIHAKGSLEAQLKLESTHKDAVSESLQQAQDESSRRISDLEEKILRDRESHRDALEEARNSVSDELKQGAERLAAVEAELSTARQRCELLMRNKADLQQEVGEHREKHATLEANVSEHRAESEKRGLELEQHKQHKATLEEEIANLQQTCRDANAQIEQLRDKVQQGEAQFSSQCDDFAAKVKNLDALIDTEREQRAAAEKNLADSRHEADVRAQQLEASRKKVEQELQSLADSWRTKAEELQQELDRAAEKMAAHMAQAETADTQRRETEAALRGENATTDARLRRVEAEATRAQTAVEEGKALLAQQQATMTARIATLERQLEQESQAAKGATSARETAESEVKKTAETRQEMMERLAMAAEEMSARQVDFTLERQRLSGALEESRRTLRNSLGVPNPGAAVDSVRLQGLEQQLSEERRKAIEQAVTLQRTERKLAQLEVSNKRGEDQRLDAVSRSREAERRLVTLSEDLRKTKVRETNADNQAREAREQASMAVAEMGTIRYEAKYEVVRLRGALDELRYMIKMQRPT